MQYKASKFDIAETYVEYVEVIQIDDNEVPCKK